MFISQTYALSISFIILLHAKCGYPLLSYTIFPTFRIKTLNQNHHKRYVQNNCGCNDGNIPSQERKLHTLNAKTKKNIDANENDINDNYNDSTYSIYEQKTQKTRKVKKNRYSKFSKVSQEQNHQDPLDKLLAESKQKNIDLKQQKKQKSKSKISTHTDPKRKRNEMTFPPLPTIDPYDPTTYGFIELGTIIGAHGIKGQVKFKSSTEFGSVRLCRPNTLRHIKMPTRRSPREIILKSGKEIDTQNNVYLLKLHNVNDRVQAKKLRGAMLYARKEQQDEILQSVVMDENEYFMNDLIGLEVYLLEDKEKEWKDSIGIFNGMVFAEDLCDVPGLGNDYLEIALHYAQNYNQDNEGNNQNPGQELVLLPFVPQIVPIVDIDEKYVFIDPPVGLLDLTYIRQKKVSIKGLLPPAKD